MMTQTDDRATFLVTVTSPHDGSTFTRTCAGVTLVGRLDESAVHLPHPLVSRKHAEIAFIGDDQFTIRDLDSRNGTYVDGTALRGSTTTVGSDVVIQIGPYVVSLRRTSGNDETLLVRAGDLRPQLRLDSDLRLVWVSGESARVRVSQIEFQLLQQLDTSYPRTLDAQALGDRLWGSAQWDSYMLHNVVSRLRRKLDATDHNGAELVITVPGLGYRLG